MVAAVPWVARGGVDWLQWAQSGPKWFNEACGTLNTAPWSEWALRAIDGVVTGLVGTLKSLLPPLATIPANMAQLAPIGALRQKETTYRKRSGGTSRGSSAELKSSTEPLAWRFAQLHFFAEYLMGRAGPHSLLHLSWQERVSVHDVTTLAQGGPNWLIVVTKETWWLALPKHGVQQHITARHTRDRDVHP
jgi:hypothetical protein